MEIRPLSQKDMNQARSLWETCFQDHPAFLDWYFQNRFCPQDGLGIFLDGRLLCDLHLSPRKIKLRNQLYPSVYLVALATTPSFRRLGLARSLLTNALRHLVARDIFFTFLLPFDTEFYTRLGWGKWANHRLYYLPTEIACNVPTLNESAFVGPPFRFEEVEPNLKIFTGIYKRWSTCWDGLLDRAEQDWTCLLLDHALDGGKTWLAMNQTGLPLGYAFVLPSSPSGQPLLRELAYTNSAVKEPFLHHLISHYAQAFQGKSKSALTKAGEPVKLNICQISPEYYKHPEETLTPYIPPGTQPAFLGRITSVQQMLGALSYPLLNAGWVMEVTDPLLPENSDLYQVKITRGKMRVTKTTGEKPVMRCSVGSLASLILGSVPPEELVRQGELTLAHPAHLPLLKLVFPPTTNFVNEYF